MINRKDHIEHKEAVSRKGAPDNCVNWCKFTFMFTERLGGWNPGVTGCEEA